MAVPVRVMTAFRQASEKGWILRSCGSHLTSWPLEPGSPGAEIAKHTAIKSISFARFLFAY